MPRFPVGFGRRRSTVDNPENAPLAEPSFRVLERVEVNPGKSFDGGARLAARSHLAKPSISSELNVDDNIFADLKTNRGSGSSNTTKATSDNSSRHSNASTTPSSADSGAHEEWRNNANRKAIPDIPVPPVPKSSSGFLKAAGRSFSFGGQRKHLPPIPVAEESQPPMPPSPELPRPPQFSGRARATTSSTDTTITPPKVDSDFNLDLGGDFSKMLLGYDKRASMMTLKEEQDNRLAPGPRSLTANRLNQPAPIAIDKTTRIEASPLSWNSHNSNDQLLSSSPTVRSPTNGMVPPPVPRHASPLAGKRPGTSPEPSRSQGLGRQPSYGDAEDEEARLLKDSLSAVNKFMSSSSGNGSGNSSSRYRRDEDTLGTSRQASWETRPARFDTKADDEELFGNGAVRPRLGGRNFASSKSNTPQSNKVMTPAEFERYRTDKERRDREPLSDHDQANDDDEEDNYEDDEDDLEKARQQTKQRQKQEAHMAVYRQQMMKVTGESGNAPVSRPTISMSFSTPNLGNIGLSAPGGANLSGGPSPPDNSDEDEEVPLAILAAHGFPNKNRPPTRLNNMMSNPNLRASQQPSYQRPGSAAGEASGNNGGRLPAFARNLPQDPFLGAGLIHNTVRESFALGGGSPAPGQPLPPGGLVGVIANEERSRAMRRGSPHIENHPIPPPGGAPFDPIGGIPQGMMYQNRSTTPVLTPGDQAQIQMTQQMQQFMQMQMQFMQMMAQNGQPMPPSMGAGLPMGGMMPGMGGMVGNPDMMRHSFVGQESMLDLPRGDAHMRTMSMVQPSSASWIQPPGPPNPGYASSIRAPSIRLQGGYAPSIAPSERSNIGLPGRYRPVSHVPPPQPMTHLRQSSTMSGALGAWSDNKQASRLSVAKSGSNSDDEDDDKGWEAMKAKREKKRSLWKSKKDLGSDIGALIS
ncbi:hypothetical protein GQ53DRAFT_869948 [Thozetella sp. PMI_491]|nr:hypothetical protein GQ53DRAFT_869948 [Thozetella sp. PMI_491]